MKKIISAIITTLLVLLPVASYEWGGLVTENFKLNSIDPSETDNIFFRQSNGISLWANIPILNDNSWYLSTQGSYKYSYGFNGFNKNGSFNQTLDLELLKLNGNVKFNDFGVSLSLGRYFVMDNTAKIFIQNCDGALLKINSSAVNLSAYVGYTGLINGNTVATLTKDGSVEINTDGVYTSTHPYVPVLFSIDFPSFILNQSFGVQACGFIDAKEDQYNRFYASAFLKGPITGPLYYSLTSCFGSENFENISNLSIFSLLAFIGNSTVKVNLEYASGKQLSFSPFRGFNSSIAYNASWAPEYSGVLLPGLDYIFSIKDVCFELNGKFVILTPENDLLIKGANMNAKATANLFSDLSVDLSIGFYHDLETMGMNNNYFGSVGMSVAF